MTRLLLPLALLTASTGCIIFERDYYYEEDEVRYDTYAEQDWDSEDWGDRPERPDDADTDGDAIPYQPLSLDPGAAVVGDTLIVSLVSDGTVDLSLPLFVDFYGPSDVAIVATLPRDADELLLTVAIDAEAEPGDNDLLVQFEDGTEFYLDDLFTIVTDAPDLPDDDADDDGRDDTESSGSHGGASSGGTTTGGTDQGGLEGDTDCP